MPHNTIVVNQVSKAIQLINCLPLLTPLHVFALQGDFQTNVPDGNSDSGQEINLQPSPLDLNSPSNPPWTEESRDSPPNQEQSSCRSSSPCKEPETSFSANLLDLSSISSSQVPLPHQSSPPDDGTMSAPSSSSHPVMEKQDYTLELKLNMLPEQDGSTGGCGFHRCPELCLNYV